MARQFFQRLWKDETGATAIEYGLIVGIMAALLITVLGTFSDNLRDLFDAITDKLADVTDEIKDGDTGGE